MFVCQSSDEVKLQQSDGPLLRNILPTNFPSGDNVNTHLPPPPNRDLQRKKSLESSFNKLFDFGHLQAIHANYFSPIGIRKGSEKKKPLRQVLFDALPSVKPRKTYTEPYMMEMAQAHYQTNFQNI
ncbi:hypothetical protein G6F37_004682 [Rhizopus arrhizus]|nr:hypothetical protein G6F38_011331 [Rhizopus arrhizus]KAG1159672.1 hypothetical protein G6F37_004682 [Rhizopus arrhizus]